jgi:hypothetical protein
MALRKFGHYDFRCQEPITRLVPTGVVATGNNTTSSNVQCGRQSLEIYYTVNNADIGFTRNALGWVCPNDNANNEGATIVCGQISSAAAPWCFTVGTDVAFYATLLFNIPTVAEYDVMAFGFVTAGACTAAIDTAAELLTAYNDVALLNVDNGAIWSNTRGAGGAGVATDTTNTWIDAASHSLTVKVSTAGVSSLLIDGAAPVVNTNVVTFAAGVVLTPCFIYCKDATATADTPPIITTLTYGYQ